MTMVWDLTASTSISTLREVRQLRSLPVDPTMLEATQLVMGKGRNEFVKTFDIGKIEGRSVTYIVVGHNALLAQPYINREGKLVHPRLGGCRPAPYDSLDEAITDIKRLARGMTYKHPCLNRLMQDRLLSGDGTSVEVAASYIGGGKSGNFIDTSDLTPDQKKEFFQKNFPNIGNRTMEGLSSFERVLHLRNIEAAFTLGGEYIYAPDMNTDVAVMDYVAQFSPYVACLSTNNRLRPGSGDPSRTTAHGEHWGLKAAMQEAGIATLRDLPVGIQGLGKVGRYQLVDMLQDKETKGAFFYLSDTEEQLEEVRENILGPAGLVEGKHYRFHVFDPKDPASADAFYDLGFVAYSPNAKGQTLTMDHCRRMRAKGLKIIAGAANNQREPSEKAEVDAYLLEEQIEYIPDYVGNEGGILNLVYEHPAVVAAYGGEYNKERPLKAVRGVYTAARSILKEAKETRRPHQRVANLRQETHLARVAQMRGFSPQEIVDGKYLER